MVVEETEIFLQSVLFLAAEYVREYEPRALRTLTNVSRHDDFVFSNIDVLPPVDETSHVVEEGDTQFGSLVGS
jgi:hypothetical protein